MEATASQRRIVSPITPSRIIVAPTDDPTRAARRALERFQKISRILQKQNCGLFRREHFLRVYWIKYYAQGKPIRENTRSRDLRRGAQRPQAALRDDGRARGKEANRRLAHLDPFFRGRRLTVAAMPS